MTDPIDPRQHAKTLYNQAISLLHSDIQSAYRCAASAVAVDETFVPGWLLAGGMLADMGNFTAAVACYRAGLRCDDADRVVRHKLLVNLGNRLMQNGEIEAAELVNDEAIWTHGRAPEGLSREGVAFAHTNQSLVYSHRGLDGAALVEARKGYELCPDPLTEMGLAFAHLFNGDYAAGLRHFEARFPYKLQQYNNLPYPRWDLERDRGGTLIVMCEQGLGDSLSFARFIPAAALYVERLIFQVQPELVGLLEHAFPANVEVVPQSHVLPPATSWCPVFSLPVTLGLDDDQIAGTPGLDGMVASDLILGHGFDPANFNIAIAWAGAAQNDIDRHRSISPIEFLPLLELPEARLWSVQVGPRVVEMHNAGLAPLVHDCSPWIRDCRDTAAVLNQVDLVVCCESFVGHLAGALDVECWVAASALGRDWRIRPSGGDGALWYPRTRVFRQGADRTWGPVFKAMVKALKVRLK